MKLSKRGRRDGWSRLHVVLVVSGLAVLSAAVAVVTRYRSRTAPPSPMRPQSVVIERPLEEVFAFVADRENDALWAPVVTQTRKTSEGPLGVGTTYEQSGRFLGRNLEMIFEVTEYEPNRKIGLRLTTSGPLRATSL